MDLRYCSASLLCAPRSVAQSIHYYIGKDRRREFRYASGPFFAAAGGDSELKSECWVARSLARRREGSSATECNLIDNFACFTVDYERVRARFESILFTVF